MTKEGDRYEIDFTASKSGSSTAFFKMVDGNTVVFVGADPSDKEEGYRLKRSGKEQVDALREKFAAKAKKELAADKLQEQQKKLDDLKAIVERNPDEAKKAEGLELIKKEQKKLDDLRAQNKAASDP